ncbi:MAG: hypothetical protein ACFCUU_09695 [Cyclobacteriaceae bacterium]
MTRQHANYNKQVYGYARIPNAKNHHTSLPRQSHPQRNPFRSLAAPLALFLGISTKIQQLRIFSL